MTDSSLILDGKSFELVKTREYSPISIYKSGDNFLRIGPKDLIQRELNLHKNLLTFGFPIPEILKEGSTENQYYYIESSLGDVLLGDVFWHDCQKNSLISENNFKIFLGVTKKFTQAQLRTSKPEKSYESFYYGLHVDVMMEELPELRSDIIKGFEKLKEQTNTLPTVLTHGDLNPYNIFEKGVIDFGSMFEAPLGYDLITNLYHTYNFPKAGDHESQRRFEFSKEQIQHYLTTIDKLGGESGLPPFSDHVEDFVFARSFWSTARMQRFPKLQKWRYNLFADILKNYLTGKPIITDFTSYPS